MRFNLNAPILSPVTLQPQVEETSSPTGEVKRKQVKIGDVILLCLAGKYDDDAKLTDLQAIARYRLKIKVINSLNDVGFIDLDDPERLIIKGCAKKGLTVDAFVQVHDFLDNPVLLTEVKAAS
jgi:hypothetical protein